MAEDEVIQPVAPGDSGWDNCGNLSNSKNGSECRGNRDELLANVEVAVLGSLLALILVSNMLVLVALVRSSLLRPMSRTYYFMTHICAADLMVGLFNVLSQLAWDLTFHFLGPNWLCKAVKFMQVMPLYLSSLLLACLAVDRYRAMSFRLGGVMWSSPRMVATVWVLASLLALPQAFLFSLQQIHPGHYNCWGKFPGAWGIRAYVVYFVIAAFFGPMLVTVYCYTCITLKVWRYSRYRRGYVPLRTMIMRRLCCITKEDVALARRGVMTGSSGGGSDTTTNSMRVQRVSLVVHSCPSVPQPLSLAKIKTIKLTFIITFFFIVCHAPFSVTQLYYAFSGTSPGQPLSRSLAREQSRSNTRLLGQPLMIYQLVPKSPAQSVIGSVIALLIRPSGHQVILGQ